LSSTRPYFIGWHPPLHNFGHPLHNFGVARCSKRGKIAAARRCYEAALDANENFAPTYHKLAEMEASIGNLEALSKLNRKLRAMENRNFIGEKLYGEEEIDDDDDGVGVDGGGGG